MEKIFINGEIGTWGAKWQKDELFYKGGVPLSVYIDSPGGSVTDGNTIAALLRNHAAQYGVEVKTVGVGMVASIATMVLLAGTKVELDADAFLMIHNPFASYVSGESKDLRQIASVLDTMKGVMADRYVAQIEKNGKLVDGDRQKTKNIVLQYMAAETWFSAQEALEFGLIDGIATYEEEKTTMQNLNASLVNKELVYQMVAQCKNIPNKLKPQQMEINKEESKKPVSKGMFAAILQMLGLVSAEATTTTAEATTETPEAVETPTEDKAPITTPATPATPEMTEEQMIEKLKEKGFKVEAEATATAETPEAIEARFAAKLIEAQNKIKALEEENAKIKAVAPANKPKGEGNGKPKYTPKTNATILQKYFGNN